MNGTIEEQGIVTLLEYGIRSGAAGALVPHFLDVPQGGTQPG